MWNNNDTKYIIKRLILYLLISGIVFFSATQCSKATVQSTTIPIQYQSHDMLDGTASWSIGFPNNTFSGVGQGYINFTLITKGGTPTYPLQYVDILVAPNGSTNTSEIYSCDIGNTMAYNDSTAQYIVYSVQCPVQIPSGKQLYRIWLQRLSSSNYMNIWTSDVITFTGNSGESQQIIDSQANLGTAITNSITNSTTRTIDAIQSQINSATQQEINAINANTTAINNQTDAINAQTEWQQQDFNPQVSVDYIDALNGVFTTEDTNVIRQLFMIPLNIFMIIYTSLTTNTCGRVSFGVLYGYDLGLPCINWQNIVGSRIYILIDTIMGICLLFGLIRYLKKVINSIFTISSNASDAVEVFK